VTVVERFFAGLTEQTFQTLLGVVDPPLTDYLSRLLVRCVRSEQLDRLRRPDGRQVEGVAQMQLEAEERIGDARRAAHRQIGDFTLFWAGLYPEALRRSRNAFGRFEDYCQYGKRSYFIAATIPTEPEDGDAPGDVLERLSTQFEMCAYGLRELRREWERRDDDESPQPFLLK
jgi:hypothetical protein